MSAAPSQSAAEGLAAAFAQFVEAHDWSRDHSKLELLQERIVVTPPAGYPRSEIAANVTGELRNFVRPRKLGRVLDASQGYALPSGDHVEPDASFVSRASWAGAPATSGERYLQVVPDLVVEILSRSNEDYDRGKKKDICEANGVRECWLVDHRARQILIFVRDETTQRFAAPRAHREGDRAASRVLEGFDVSVSDILAV